jgi:hypothetical protein
MTAKVFKRKESSEESPLYRASEAVERYQEAKQLLDSMQESFKRSYPEAYRAFLNILAQMDEVQERIKEAHSLVQESKESVGEFKCVRKWKSAGYDPVEFVNLLAEYKKAGKVVEEMVKAGAVEKIVLSDRAQEYFSTNPEASSHFQNAWKDRAESTAAVTCPKIVAGF